MLLLIIIIYEFTTDVYLPSFPFMAKSFNVSFSKIEFTVTIAMIFLSIASLIYGPISDYYGRRKVLISGFLIFVAGSFLCYFSKSFSILIAGRILQATGVACGGIGAGIAKDLFSGKNLARVLSVFSIKFSF